MQFLIYTTFVFLAFPNSSPGQEVSPPEARTTALYTIHPEKSTFTVYAFRGGLFGRFGHDHTIAIRDFSGTISMADGAPETTSLVITVQAASFEVMDDIKEDERQEITQNMNTNVLEVDRYPEIVYQSDAVTVDKMAGGVYDATMIGSLNLHGVHRPEILTARVTIENNLVRATGEFMIKQKDYGIKPVSVLGGTIKVKNELKFTFDIVAERSLKSDD